MKAFKTILKVLAAIVAVAGVAAAVYLLIQRFVGDKKAAAYYDDEDFFDCDCDMCDVIECDKEALEELGDDVAQELEAEAQATAKVAKAVKNAKNK